MVFFRRLRSFSWVLVRADPVTDADVGICRGHFCSHCCSTFLFENFAAETEDVFF